MEQSKREELEKSLSARIAACITQHRAEIALPAAHCGRPRIGMFAQNGILRDGAWQVYGLDLPIADAIFEAGGFPFGIPGIPVIRGLDTFEVFADLDAFRAVFDTLWPMMLNLDGLLLPGGADLDARLYLQEPHPQLQEPDLWLDILQMLAALIAWITYLPTFGISRGLQVMNVARGGSLFQDHQELYEQRARNMPPLLAHRRGRPVYKNLINHSHPLIIRQRSWLAQAVRGRGERRPPRYYLDAVLSQHQNFIGVCGPGTEEIIGQLAPGLQVVGTAPDGVIEAIADTNPLRVFIAVQFHPEYVTSLEWSMGIFTYYVDACARYAAFPRAELQEFQDDVCAWLWHAIRERFIGDKPGPIQSSTCTTSYTEELKTGQVPIARSEGLVPHLAMETIGSLTTAHQPKLYRGWQDACYGCCNWRSDRH
jgi:putative glutamine amidotransferase